MTITDDYSFDTFAVVLDWMTDEEVKEFLDLQDEAEKAYNNSI